MSSEKKRKPKREYRGKLVKTIRGQRYIEYAPEKSISGSTAKAYRIAGKWIPISQTHIDRGIIYISEWFYVKILAQRPFDEIESLKKLIAESERQIARAQTQIDHPDPFSTRTPEEARRDIVRAQADIVQLEKRIKYWEEQKEGFE
jgi:hypothetical protein